MSFAGITSGIAYICGSVLFIAATVLIIIVIAKIKSCAPQRFNDIIDLSEPTEEEQNEKL